MGRWIGVLEYKLEIDFSDAESIKDEWIRFTGNEALIFGHMKEPFSLENLTSSTHTAFMERSLPTRAFSPGRNFGAVAVGTRRGALTWSFGYFLNTGSLSFDGQSKDQLSAGNGIDLAIRITDLVQFQDDGRRLTHLGFSWPGFRSVSELPEAFEKCKDGKIAKDWHEIVKNPGPEDQDFQDKLNCSSQ
ncbi:MAG: porin, partial [Thermodesulfobacteriota bacterium]|nr:porin [Thermodesulfobacteriota bacterium]